jgi:hypothetical protein
MLVREDEVGRRYAKQNWHAMFRTEFDLENNSRKRINKELKLNYKTDPKLKRKTRLIVHPTRRREDFFSEGKLDISITDSGPVISVQLKRYPKIPKKLTKSVFLPEKTIRLEYKLKKINNGYRISGQGHKEYSKTESAIIMQALSFLRHGLNSSQIKSSRNTQLRFITWKDAPTNLEFYDLIEKRNKQ